MTSNQPNHFTAWSGHREFTIDELASLQPGLGRLMPEIGDRYWKLYYAAKARNWPMALFQLKEVRGLMQMCIKTRPKYQQHLETFISKDLAAIEDAIQAHDWVTFEKTYDRGIHGANGYHKLYDKEFIVWKLPSYPPPDLDLTPRPS